MTHQRTMAVVLLLAILVAGLMSADLYAQTTSPEWLAAERGDITLWHTQGQEPADDLADHAQGAYDLVSELIDTEIPASLTIIVWPPGADPADTEQLPDGVTAEIPPVNVLSNTSGDVRNAVTNALINAATGQYAAEVPVWMRAALGLWSQGPLPGFFLRRAGSVLYLDYEEFYTTEQLEVVPTTWQFQARYFGQAGGMLAWLLQDWGPDALADLFRAVGEGVPFYDAVEEIYGIPEDELISTFTDNAERALLLNWPYIESQDKPFYDQLNLNHVIMIAAAIPVALLLFFVGKRMFYD
ncbi:MAG: hypothetical protein OXH19_04000 [Chloroflexi bacterium]|nr:hypothetical protein [Chloroflexota bacterium]MCY3588437.1 hypothetical protein [Chloroflexota bacterium]MCY3686846.1 hypothetical protein [Chloroflexota bacterium]MDE2709362.1 hypothetical protein [Chloroflexota bacterium]